MSSRLEFKTFGETKPDKLCDFLNQYPYKPYGYFVKDDMLLAKYLWTRLSQIADSNNEVIVVESGDSVVAVAALEVLPWDSEHFGFNCGKISYLIVLRNNSYLISYKISKYFLGKQFIRG